ncbi:MAG TPA: anti-sigma factor [Chloroflexota bacterium]|nr:anti-sigma factor [Chloroflexota bacterium]
MNSPHPEDALPAYALGALDLESAEQVHSHLSQCPSCRVLTLRALHGACTLPFSLAAYPVPPEVKERVVGRAKAIAGATEAAPEDAASEEPTPQAGNARIETPPRRRSLARVLIRGFTFLLPWAAAVVGWLAAGSLLLYSHGVSDRVRTTTDTYQGRIAGLTSQIAQTQALRGYLLLPRVAVEPLKNWISATSSTRVQLIRAPGYAHGIVIAHHLAPPPSGEQYVVWDETQDHVFQSLGTFITSRPDGDALLVVGAAQPLDRLLEVGISIEPTPGPTAPTSALLFTAALSTPTALPTRTPTAIPATESPTLAGAGATAAVRHRKGANPTATPAPR